jgi:thioredoxin-like negative regulator of GroEL
VGALLFVGAGVLDGCASPGADLRADSAPVQLPEIATAADFDAKVVKAGGAVFVEFAKSPCASCEALAPTIDRLVAAYRGRVAFYRVDVDASRPLAAARSVHLAPTVFVFRDGRQVAGPLAGDYPESTYRQAIDNALGK